MADVNAAFPYWMSLLHVHIECPCCILMLHAQSTNTNINNLLPHIHLTQKHNEADLNIQIDGESIRVLVRLWGW